MIRKISHIGIAVQSLDSSIPFYRDILGLPYTGNEVVEDQGARVAFFEIGESRIELLEPLGPDTPVARFLERRGPGLHHVAYECDDVGGHLIEMADQGIELVDGEPRPGAHGMDIAFLHPRSTDGLLTELCEPHRSEDTDD